MAGRDGGLEMAAKKRGKGGWRHGGTGSAERDGNMRDTSRSPTVRLIRSRLPCVPPIRGPPFPR